MPISMLSERPNNAYQVICASGACTNSLSAETTNFASRACKNEKLGKFSSKLSPRRSIEMPLPSHWNTTGCRRYLEHQHPLAINLQFVNVPEGIAIGSVLDKSIFNFYRLFIPFLYVLRRDVNMICSCR
jgi:hypothetical protein